jgi:hypothetical protein
VRCCFQHSIREWGHDQNRTYREALTELRQPNQSWGSKPETRQWLHHRYLVSPAPLVFLCWCTRKKESGFAVPCHVAVGLHFLRVDGISTLLVGRKFWQGWIIAGANSALICLIGIRTAQFGFVPANLFCIVLYSYNVRSWKK